MGRLSPLWRAVRGQGIAVALLGFWLSTSVAPAVPITEEQAETAVRTWLAGDTAPPKERFAEQVGTAKAHAREDGTVLFHATRERDCRAPGGGCDGAEPTTVTISVGAQQPEVVFWMIIGARTCGFAPSASRFLGVDREVRVWNIHQELP